MAAATAATRSTQRVPSPTGSIRTPRSAGTAPATRLAGNPYEHHQPGDRHGDEVGDDADHGELPEHQHTRYERLRAGRPAVIANGVASGPSPESRRRNGGPITVTPAVAPTDSQNPTERTSSGSTSSNTTTETASSRGGSRSAPSGKGERRQRRHRAGPQNRRFGTSEHHEPADQGDRAGEPQRRPGPLQQRGGERQRECDVLPRNGRQVGQATLTKAGRHRFGLGGVVSDDQSAGERGVVGAERSTLRR